MTRAEFAARLKNACAAVTAAEAELTEIDSKFGDADHGLTMAKAGKRYLRGLITIRSCSSPTVMDSGGQLRIL